MAGVARATGRHGAWWLALVAAITATTVLVVEGPPGSGYGWGSVAVSCLLVAVPLVGMGLMVRTGERRYAWPTLVLAAGIVFFALAALLGNWSGQTPTNRVLDLVSTVLMLAASLAAVLVALRLLRRHA